MQICFLKKNKLFIFFFIEKETKQLLKKELNRENLKQLQVKVLQKQIVMFNKLILKKENNKH